MTGDVVNLRLVRKRKARADKAATAEQNRVAFGRTKAEKTLTRALNDKAEAALDGGRIEPRRDAPSTPRPVDDA